MWKEKMNVTTKITLWFWSLLPIGLTLAYLEWNYKILGLEENTKSKIEKIVREEKKVEKITKYEKKDDIFLTNLNERSAFSFSKDIIINNIFLWKISYDYETKIIKFNFKKSHNRKLEKNYKRIISLFQEKLLEEDSKNYMKNKNQPEIEWF